MSYCDAPLIIFVKCRNPYVTDVWQNCLLDGDERLVHYTKTDLEI
jgi:hypothetical protein